MIERPVTLAVIDPREMAARAVVEIWPIDITETITSEYSRRWVLWATMSTNVKASAERANAG